MSWIKRNLFLLIGSVASLGLLGFAGFFLYTKYQADRAITEELNKNITDLKRLANRDPHPGTPQVDNISAAEKEAERVGEFLGEVTQFFPLQITNTLDSRGFRAMLDTVISGLRNGADASGVKLPEDYWFTFSAQKSAVQFDTNTLTTLAAQLLEVNELCKVLFDAKVVALDSVRRAPVTEEDSGYQDYLSEETGETNQYAVLMPYEVTFRGFSSEIARVFEGLIRSKGAFFVVKNVGVNRADASPMDSGMPFGDPSRFRQSSPDEGGANPYGRYGPMMRGGGRGMSPGMLSRYGIGPAQPFRPAHQPNPRGSIIDEKMLRITLTLESVRLVANNASAGMPVDMGVPEGF